jgi:hypothetical protein
MGLDIRIPLGLVFQILGGIMALFGLFTREDVALYEKSLGLNLNLVWGAVIFLFGAIMFFMGRRQKWQHDSFNPEPWETQAAIKPRH